MEVNMNSTPPKVIGKEACLRSKGPFGLSKDPKPKRHLNILWKEESKEIGVGPPITFNPFNTNFGYTYLF